MRSSFPSARGWHRPWPDPSLRRCAACAGPAGPATRLAGLARATVAMPTTLAGLVLALASALRLSIAVASLALRATVTAGPSFLRSGLGAGLKPRPISWSRRVSLIGFGSVVRRRRFARRIGRIQRVADLAQVFQQHAQHVGVAHAPHAGIGQRIAQFGQRLFLEATRAFPVRPGALPAPARVRLAADQTCSERPRPMP